MITSGLVSFEDGRKASEEYAPPKKARVEFRFDVPEGEKDVGFFVDGVIALACAKVADMLGHVPAQGKLNVALSGAPELPPSGSSEPVDKPKRGRPPKSATPVTDPAAMSEPAPAEDLSDKALIETVVAINTKIKKPDEIKAMIRKFCPDDGIPASIKRIPVDHRSDFLVHVRAMAN